MTGTKRTRTSRLHDHVTRLSRHKSQWNQRPEIQAVIYRSSVESLEAVFYFENAPCSTAPTFTHLRALHWKSSRYWSAFNVKYHQDVDPPLCPWTLNIYNLGFYQTKNSFMSTTLCTFCSFIFNLLYYHLHLLLKYWAEINIYTERKRVCLISDSCVNV